MPETTHPPPGTVPGPEDLTSADTGLGTGTGTDTDTDTDRLEAESEAERFRTDEPAFTDGPAFPDLDGDDE